MIRLLKNLGRKIIPKKLFKLAQPYWHGFWGLCAHYYYGKPSDKLIVIGVTGTKGKTSTAHITYQLLNSLGASCGLISTAVIDDGSGERLNWFRMTQMSGSVTHQLLAQMVQTGKRYAVIEVSSEGLAQNRHAGINFDIAVFTNLTPDHVDAHGGFDKYKEAKAVLFKALGKLQVTNAKLQINPKIQKTIVSNLDSEYGLYYLNFKADKHVTYGIVNKTANIVGQDIVSNTQGSGLQIANFKLQIKLPGKFNVYNVLAAISVAETLGYEMHKIAEAVTKLKTIPGRMEVLQTKPFVVLVDYAHEKASMTALYETVTKWPHKRIIQVFGATGGVRDKSRRTDLGKLAGQFADIAIITDEDPFDEDPQTIIHDIADAVIAASGSSPTPPSVIPDATNEYSSAGDPESRIKNKMDSGLPSQSLVETGMTSPMIPKIIGQTLFRNPNRREAIAKALSLAQPGDLVLITGKGAEQRIARAHGTYEPWDDRTVTREELRRLQNV